MKKLVLFVITLVLLSANLYATSSQALVKGGILASPYLNLDGDLYDVDLGFTLGGEFYVFPVKNVGLGVGFTHLYKTDVENTGKKMKLNNLYLSVKPRIMLSKEIDCIYLLGQLGISSADIKFISGDTGKGVYAAIGCGFEADWFIAEATYSYNNWAVSDEKYKRAGFYTLAINIGYKFEFDI